MTEPKTICRSCGRSILASTAIATGGFCRHHDCESTRPEQPIVTDAQDVLDLLRFAAKQQWSLLFSSKASSDISDGVLRRVEENLSSTGQAFRDQARHRIRTNARRLWREQPFCVGGIDVRGLALGVAMRRRFCVEGEEWRTKAIVSLDTLVLESSEWSELFREELAVIPMTERGDDPLILRWDGRGFDLDLTDFSGRLQCKDCRWLWIVKENLDDFPEPAREALWQSPFGRLRDPGLHSLTVARARSAEALADLDACLERDIWQWRKLPLYLLKTEGREHA